MLFFKNMIKGILIGAGAIIPGVSSGVICVIFGLYEKLLDSVLNIFRDFKKNIKFLFPILVGLAIGIVLFGKTLNFLYINYEIQTKSIFIGLILGSIPALIKEVNNNIEYKFYNTVFILLGLLIGGGMFLLEKYIPNTSLNYYDFKSIIISGMCMSIGIIIPGVSSTVILMILGIYNTYLTSIANIYLPFLIPLGIGLFIGSIFCMKIMKVLFNKYYLETFYIIIGFTIGSIFVLVPNFSFDLKGLISIICILLGWLVSVRFNLRE